MDIPLNPQQKEARNAPFDPLLIVAGAGTGKTRVLTSRIMHLIENGAPPREICAITFTNKAAREMADRVEAMGNFKKGEGPILGTFHSLCARILRREYRHIDRKPNFIIFDEGDSSSLLKRVVKEFALAKKLGPQFFRDKIGRIKDGTLQVSSDSTEDEIIKFVFERYEEELQKNNALDFDDLIHKTVFVLQKFPQVLNKYQKMFRHVLVDEYQDVSNMQYEFIKLLGSGAKSVSVVGDSDQTIYTWRGSNIKYFLGFEKDWPKSKIVFLEENYRSSANIIEAASALIKNNSERPSVSREKTLFTNNPRGIPIKLFEASGPEGEAWWIASQIEEVKLTASSVAVLYRTNAQSRAIEQALLQKGVPYIIFGGLKFYERREVKDILAGVRYASNPDDTISAERLLKTFKKRMFSELQMALGTKAPPIEVIKIFIKTTDYFSYIERNLTNPLDRRENIAELIRFAAGFDTLQDFLDKVALLQSTDQAAKENRDEAVNLMTMHLAKGLEFDKVFIAGANEGILPHAKSLSLLSELEEERRLLYVAMTRARRELYISFCDLPSRFLNELPGNCTTFESEISDSTSYEDSDEKYITLE